MNLPNSEFLKLIHFPNKETSPKLESIVLAWDHITSRYVNRFGSNRILSGRIRSIRLLAVHDAIQAVLDPGNGHLFKAASTGSTTEAALAAATQAAHDLLAAVFPEPEDQRDLADLLEETFALFGDEVEKSAGSQTGSQSAATYVKAFAPVLQDHRVHSLRPVSIGGDRHSSDAWRRSA